MAGRILWAVVCGFLLGVFARSFIPLGLAFAAFAALMAVATFALSFIDGGKSAAAITIAAALLAFSGGILRMNAATLLGDPTLTAHLDQKVVLEGIVSAEPDARESGTLVAISVDTLAAASSSVAVGAGVLAHVPPHADIFYGDRVRVSGTLQLPQSFDTGLGRQFNYPYYLAKDGIGYELAFAQIERTGKNEGNMLKAAAIRVKQLYLKGQDAALPEPEAGLAAGITVGDKRSIGPELSADFQRVSLIHMVVLSGYNITVVMNMVRTGVQFFPRFIQYSGLGAAVIFFVLMSGGAASAVRAGAMALIAVFARATGRIFLAGRILGVVAAAMVLWNPWTLAFDPSFELSALATLGLILFTPIFEVRLQWVTAKFKLREIFASTLATQLMVLPLLLYQNGNLSIVALPANLLALLPVPLTMFFSVIAAVGGMLFGAYAVPIAFPAYVLLVYIISVAKFFAAFPFAAVSVPAFSAWWLLAAYALMFGWFWVYEKRATAPGAVAPRD